jgi:GAF domain-containing protein
VRRRVAGPAARARPEIGLAVVTSVSVTRILAGITDRPVPPEQLPQRLVEACAAAVPVSGVGMLLMTDRGPAGVVAATDGAARTMEDLQFTLGEGPCVDASRTGSPVLQDDLARTGPSRWPAFTTGALGAGIRAIFALPLRVGGIRLGVLDLYRDRPGALDPDELRAALHHADAATTVLLHLQGLQGADGAGRLTVVDDRAEVHQATGVVAEQAGVSLAEALVLLRARAFAAERDVTEVALDVLARRFVFDDVGPPPVPPGPA